MLNIPSIHGKVVITPTCDTFDTLGCSEGPPSEKHTTTESFGDHAVACQAKRRATRFYRSP